MKSLATVKKNIASIFKKGEKRTLGTTDLLVHLYSWEDHGAILPETVLMFLEDLEVTQDSRHGSTKGNLPDNLVAFYDEMTT